MGQVAEKIELSAQVEVGRTTVSTASDPPRAITRGGAITTTTLVNDAQIRIDHLGRNRRWVPSKTIIRCHA